MYNIDKWREAITTHSRSTRWIKCKLTNGEEIFTDHKGWLDIKTKCDSESLFLTEWSLQFKSHEVTIDIDEDAEGVYFARSIMGRMGGKSLQYYTTGILKDNMVHKKMWLIPELIVDRTAVSCVEECFTETLIYNNAKKKKNS
jgi:hypothetical protein